MKMERNDNQEETETDRKREEGGWKKLDREKKRGRC